MSGQGAPYGIKPRKWTNVSIELKIGSACGRPQGKQASRDQVGSAVGGAADAAVWGRSTAEVAESAEERNREILSVVGPQAQWCSRKSHTEAQRDGQKNARKETDLVECCLFYLTQRRKDAEAQRRRGAKECEGG